MKKRTSNLSRRIVSLLMSMVLTLTLVTPAAFAAEVVDGSGTAIVEGDVNPTDAAPGVDDGTIADTKDTDSGDSYDVQEDTLLGVSLYTTAAVWDGKTADTSWYNASKNEFEINTAAELAGLAKLVNDGTATFSGKTIKLTAEIRLNEQDVPTANDNPNSWTPIGNASTKKFQGTFDGDGHTISGLYINNVTSGNQGLFGQIGNGNIVQNLIVTGSITSTANEKTAGIVAASQRSKGVVKNCGFYGSIDGFGTDVGGVIGGGTATNCWYYYTGTDENYSRSVGGAATNCYTNVNTAQTGVTVVTEERFKGADLVTLLNGKVPTGCKSWAQGTDYPVFATGGTEQGGKTISLIPLFPDCDFTVSVVGAAYDNDKRVYTVSADTTTVKLTRSDGETELWVTLDEKGKDGAQVPVAGYPLTSQQTTLYYGTKDDFDTIAAWNSAFSSRTGNATIKNAAELKALARMVNSGKNEMKDKTVTLSASIDLNNDMSWTPIGTVTNPFKGTFTGYKNSTYYTISNLTGDLFGVVDSSKTIQYVTISGGAGRLVGTLTSGTVQYCMSTANVTGSAGGLVGQNSGTVSSCYYYNVDSKNIPAADGSGTVTKCFYLADSSTFGEENDTGARTVDEFKLGRVAYELGASTSVWVYDTTKADEKMPQLGRAYATMAVANELKLTKPDNQPEGVVVTLGSSDKKVLTDANGNQYYYAASGYPEGVSDVPVTFTAPTGYQIVFAPVATKVGGISYLCIKINVSTMTGSTVYTYSAVKADISWYENHKAEKAYAFRNSDELVGLALLVNETLGVSESFEGWTLSLEKDIDLTGVNWIPIGQSNKFAGTFNGNNHTITGLNAVVTTGYAGLFGNLTGTVRNLQVEGSVTASGSVTYVGGIVGYNNGGTVQNCLSNVTVNAAEAANKPVGGVVGQNTGTVNLCWNKGSVIGAGFTGGVVGSGTVTNCANFGAVTGGTSYSVGGIAGSGAVANSYNLGDVTGAANMAYGISNGTVTNSYYICKLNGTEKMAYVHKTDTKDITYNEADKTYTVGEDAALLVDKLNGENRGGNTPWFVNPAKGVYLPIHVFTWMGDKDERFEEQTVTVTYYPNGGVNKDGADEPISVTVTLMPDTDTGSFAAVSYTILAADSETLGFKHENGAFNTWKDRSGNLYAAGSTVQVSDNITLYAQWDNIWAGTGTESDPYQISNAEKLTALQTQVNDKGFAYDGKWFKLTDSITLTGNWTPIGAPRAFAGSLDGNGKTIDGLNVNVTSGNAGLFASASGGTFKDFKLNGTVNGTFYTGGVIGGGSGVTLDNIEVNMTVSGGIHTGGLVGRLLGTLPATTERTPDISNCTVHGSVIGKGYVGGIATSSGDNSPKIENCRNYASVTSTGTNNASAAGIWACNTYNASGGFTNCINNGAVTSQTYAAGIATAGKVSSCVNSAAIAGNEAAGISNNASTVEYSGNTAVIHGTDYAAGILINGGYGGKVDFCYNTGDIQANNPNRAFGILYGQGSSNEVHNSFSYVTGKDIALAPNTLADGKVTNSYYLASKKDAVSSAGEWASADDFASGKVAWGVDGGEGAHANYWTQGANNYPVPIGEGTSTSYYRAKATCGTGGTVALKSNRNFTGDADNAVYGPKNMSVTVTATPKDNTYGLKSLTLDLMGTGSTTALESGDSFTLGEANALVVATFASTGSGGNGGNGGGGSGSGTGADDGDGTDDENDEGLQDGLNMDVEYDIKGLVLSAYAEWGANGGGKTFVQWLRSSPNVLRAFITNSLDNMASAAKSKDTDESKGLAAVLLASLNEHSGLDSKNGDIIGKALQRYMDTGSEATFSTWLTTGSGMASGTVEDILAQYTDSLLNLTERLYTKWESSGTSLTFPVWLDSQQVSMDSLSENADEPDTDTANDPQTSDAPDDVPDGQDTEGGASGNSVWEIIGTVVRENPILVWSIVAVIAALIIVGAVRRYHKVKRDEHDEK